MWKAAFHDFVTFCPAFWPNLSVEFAGNEDGELISPCKCAGGQSLWPTDSGSWISKNCQDKIRRTAFFGQKIENTFM